MRSSGRTAGPTAISRPPRYPPNAPRAGRAVALEARARGRNGHHRGQVGNASATNGSARPARTEARPAAVPRCWPQMPGPRSAPPHPAAVRRATTCGSAPSLRHIPQREQAPIQKRHRDDLRERRAPQPQGHGNARHQQRADRIRADHQPLAVEAVRRDSRGQRRHGERQPLGQSDHARLCRADPVNASTSNGNATVEAWEPSWESASPLHRSAKSRFLTSGERTGSTIRQRVVSAGAAHRYPGA